MRPGLCELEDSDGEHHDDCDVQAPSIEVLIKLRVGHGRQMGEFRTGGQDSSRAGV